MTESLTKNLKPENFQISNFNSKQIKRKNKSKCQKYDKIKKQDKKFKTPSQAKPRPKFQ